ncbi:hypothetical protein [Streptomyces roseoverticillatus]|uniref:hypothetical protein n=1 Tax=Streptomyces roseoverticillatus TaxID=66429 RepID=UPI001F2A7F68|nr:hypothetical protein [Streptomyces roseoverticillatus]
MVLLTDGEWDRSLRAVPLSQLMAAEGFAKAVTDRTGMPPRLQAADLRPLISGVPEPRMSSTYLLDPQAQVVDFSGMKSVLDDVEQWCNSAELLDVAVVTGVGGTGKSRLVAELLARLTGPGRGEGRAWSGGFLARSPDTDAYPMLASAAYPLLIAVDVAEARLPVVRELAATMADRHDGHKVRILLLARSLHPWWPGLRRSLYARHAGPADATFHVPPGEAFGDHSPEGIYSEAKAAFARRIRLLHQAGHSTGTTWQKTVVADAPREFGDGVEHAQQHTVVYHHVAALADLLAHANPDLARREHPIEVLLAHEEDYLRQMAQAHLSEQVKDELLRSLVLAQYLAGAQTDQDAGAVLRAGAAACRHGHGALEEREIAQLDDLLAAAYPATDLAHWSSIGEPLAAALLTEVEKENGGTFTERFLQHDDLPDSQRQQSLTAIARITQTQPELAAGAHRAVAAAPARLLAHAINTLTVHTDPNSARQWLDGIRDALTRRARQPGADPDLYRGALLLLDHMRQPARTETADIDEPINEPDNDGQPSTVQPEEPESGPTATATSPPPPDHDHATRPPWTARPRTGLTLVKPRVSRATRFFVTLFALMDLVMLVVVTTAAATAADLPYSRGILWWLLPINLFLHLTAASLIGGHGPTREPIAWVATLLTLGLITATGTLLSNSWQLPSYLPAWSLWGAVFTLGLFAVTFAWRIWVGRWQPAPAEGEEA